MVAEIVPRGDSYYNGMLHQSGIALSRYLGHWELPQTFHDNDIHIYRNDKHRYNGAEKKNDNKVLTAREIQVIDEALKSVGRICFPYQGVVGYGTGFLVGSEPYIFTAWHIVRDIISVHKVGMPTSHDLSKLAVPEVYIDFGAAEADTSHTYHFKPGVLYYDEQLDVALLQLQEKTAKRNAVYFPPALIKYTKLEDIKEIIILGHRHQQKYKVADMMCEVITDSSPKLIAAKDWFQLTGQKFVIDCLQKSGQMISQGELKSPYAKVTDQQNIVCDCFVTKDGSGSPMINSGGEVVGLYTCGIPSFYWTVMSDSDQADDLKKYAFGCGVKFNAIYFSMKNYMKQMINYMEQRKKFIEQTKTECHMKKEVPVTLDENMIEDIFSLDKCVVLI